MLTRYQRERFALMLMFGAAVGFVGGSWLRHTALTSFELGLLCLVWVGAWVLATPGPSVRVPLSELRERAERGEMALSSLGRIISGATVALLVFSLWMTCMP